MSLNFAIAFGGPLLLGLIGFAVTERMRRADAKDLASPRKASEQDLDAALAVAQAAARQAEAEIARVRARLAS